MLAHWKRMLNVIVEKKSALFLSKNRAEWTKFL